MTAPNLSRRLLATFILADARALDFIAQRVVEIMWADALEYPAVLAAIKQAVGELEPEREAAE